MAARAAVASLTEFDSMQLSKARARVSNTTRRAVLSERTVQAEEYMRGRSQALLHRHVRPLVPDLCLAA